jgi:carbon storage regulator
MLVLSRKQSQQIVVGRDIRITVVKVDRNQVRLGIEAPRGITILREELTSERFTAVHDECSAQTGASAGRGLAIHQRIANRPGSTAEF